MKDIKDSTPEHHLESTGRKISYRDRLQQIRALQSLPLKEKIKLTEVFIDHLLCDHKRPVVTWSGGRDSTVLLSIIMRQKRDIDVAWINTGVEFPECTRFVHHIKNDWHLNLHVAKPETNFWDITQKYGWPMLGKGGSGYWWSRADRLERQGKTRLAQATREAQISAACCRILKEKPMKKLCRSLEADCVIVGNMVSESRQRFLTWAQRGQCYFSKRERRCTAWPIAWWTHEDILEYHRVTNLPHSPIYDMGHTRNGCWPCLMDIRFPDNKLKALRKSHPKLWRFLIVDKGLGTRIIALKRALSKNGQSKLPENLQSHVERLVEQQPEYFEEIHV
jgi:3'-phosphoadenosine 5'-phosphosulfate sulfotransferase (PAPS reductase)/FAD synthetase